MLIHKYTLYISYNEHCDSAKELLKTISLNLAETMFSCNCNHLRIYYFGKGKNNLSEISTHQG